MTIDEPRADIVLPMHRSLWEAPVKQQFDDPRPAQPLSAEELESVDELFAGQRIDATKLRAVLASMLSLFPTGLTVKEALELEPLTEGLAELVTVLEVAVDAQWLTEVDGTSIEEIVLTEPGRRRVASVPRMVLEDSGELTHDGY